MKRCPTLILGVSALLLTSCITDGEMGGQYTGLYEPHVLNMTISPSTIAEHETGTAQFDIEISIADSWEKPESVRVFIQDGDRRAHFDEANLYLTENLVIIDGVIAGWFQGYDAGVYEIGVEITTSDVSEWMQIDVAAVKIEK